VRSCCRDLLVPEELERYQELYERDDDENRQSEWGDLLGMFDPDDEDIGSSDNEGQANLRDDLEIDSKVMREKTIAYHQLKAFSLRVQRSFWSGRRWTSISPDRAGIGRCATAQRLETEALLLRHSLLVGPATKPDAPFPTLKVGVSLMALPGLLPLVLEVVERERGRRLQALLRRSLCQTSRHRSLCHARRWS
jgi:hypothetical protein